jgi:hypothetical protein
MVLMVLDIDPLFLFQRKEDEDDDEEDKEVSSSSSLKEVSAGVFPESFFGGIAEET